VGTTGLIFGAIAIAWLAYLVPHFARRRVDDEVEQPDPVNRFSESMRILERGTAPLLDQDLAEIHTFEVSTPLTRRAAIADLQRLEGLAARRRRRVLISLLLALTVVLAVYAAGYLPLWSVAIPAGLVLVFLLTARISVHLMRRSLDARYDAICAGSEEATVFLSRRDVAKGAPARKPESAEPVTTPGTLWDPVPITMPTYVSKPLAPRTVRTIDLSGPQVAASSHGSIPVLADAPLVPPQQVRDDEGDDRREAASA